MLAVEGNTMSGVEVATMMRSISLAVTPAASSAGRLIDVGEVAGANACALHDPLVVGFDALFGQLGREIGVGEAIGRQVAARSHDF
jgi:hypothetical protein